MKKLLTTLAITATALAVGIGQLHAQTTSTSNVVGFTTHAIPSGNNPFAPGFVHPNDWAGPMSSIAEGATDTTITLAAALTPNALDEGQYPNYYVEVIDPAATTQQGYIFDVVSNTATQVVVSGKMSTDFGLAGTEQIAIRKHMTIGDVFASSTGLTGFVDSVKFFNDNGTESSLAWDGTKWTPNFVDDHSDHPVYPGSGFVTVFGGIVNVTITGTVKSTPTKVPAYAGVLTFVSALTPVDTTVGALDLVPVLAPFSENIKVFNKDGTLSELASYATNGTFMTKDFINDHGSDPIANDDSFLLNVGSDKYWTVPAAYTP